MTNMLRMTMQDGTIREITLTDGPATATLPSCAIAYIPQDDCILVDEDGQISVRDAVAPLRHEAA
jgi:hypothetical protein